MFRCLRLSRQGKAGLTYSSWNDSQPEPGFEMIWSGESGCQQPFLPERLRRGPDGTNCHCAAEPIPGIPVVVSDPENGLSPGFPRGHLLQGFCGIREGEHLID